MTSGAGRGEPPDPATIAEPRTDNIRGAMLIVLSGFTFVIEGVILKTLAGRVPDIQLVFFRAVVQLITMSAIVLWFHGPGILRTNRPALHALRGSLSLGSWGFYYASFIHLDFALATTLNFTTSLFVLALAAPILGERVGRARVLATLAGFVGVAIVARIWTGDFKPAVGLGLLAAMTGGSVTLLNRALTRTERTMTIMFYVGLVGVVASMPFAIWFWKPLPWTEFGLAMAIALLGMLGMYIGIEAYRVGEVSALAPYPYTRIVMAVAVGWFFFSEVPAFTTLIGAAIIIASVLGVTYWELSALSRRRRGDTAG